MATHPPVGKWILTRLLQSPQPARSAQSRGGQVVAEPGLVRYAAFQEMNYLAHLYLAEHTPESLIGNLVADFVKGSDLSHLTPGIQRGIRLHRRVDSFTDSHPVVQRSIARISAKWGWFSGILIDVYYDHILATTWEEWSSESLRAFVDRVHQQLAEHVDLSPAAGSEMIGKLIESDRLFSYQTSEGIHDALFWLSRRIRERMPKREIQLEQAVPDLIENTHALTEDFREFFPDLSRAVAVFIEATR
jgi:acyl carrier protein phosphodiesterase